VNYERNAKELSLPQKLGRLRYEANGKMEMLPPRTLEKLVCEVGVGSRMELELF